MTSDNHEMNDLIRVHVNLEIDSKVLQTIVANTKKITGCDFRGHYRVDTAEIVATLIGKFLVERNFNSYVNDLSNY